MPGLRELSAATLAVAGVVVDLLGFRAFNRAKTAIDPVRPDAASTLVTEGIYRHTPAQFTMRYEGKPALGLQVSMVKGGNVLHRGNALATELDRIKADLPAGVEVHDVAFQPRVVKESVNEFQRSFAEALVIVLIVSFVSLGWRTGIVVALSVPLVVGIVLMV